MGIKFNLEKCYACRMCQLACSFHHTGHFWPEKSSIDQYRRPTQGTIVWKIDQTCDLCAQESQPLCVKYCKYDALHMKEGS